MTPTVEDLIGTLQKLVGDINSLDDKVKSLTRDSHELNKTVKLTKEFHQELSIINNLSESQPRASLISALQDEIKQIHHLEKENRDLHIAIDQHQQVLEIVMVKYREQRDLLRRINDLEADYKLSENDLIAQRHEYFQQKVDEMTLIMDKACQVSDDKIVSNEQNISKINQENNRIKQLLLQK